MLRPYPIQFQGVPRIKNATMPNGDPLATHGWHGPVDEVALPQKMDERDDFENSMLGHVSHSGHRLAPSLQLRKASPIV